MMLFLWKTNVGVAIRSHLEKGEVCLRENQPPPPPHSAQSSSRLVTFPVTWLRKYFWPVGDWCCDHMRPAASAAVA